MIKSINQFIINEEKKMSEKLTISKLTDYVLYAIPLAMGITSIILSIVSMVQSTPVPDMTLPLGLGLSCLAILGLDSVDKEEES